MTEPLSQRRLAIELRYQIDMAVQWAKRSPRFGALRKAAVVSIVANHPQGMQSRHVLHNLGKERLEWLRKEGIFGGDQEPRTRP